MNYTHLTDDKRYEIYERKGRGEKLIEMAYSLGRSKSTISRELARNTGDCGYRPKQAHELARSRLLARRGGKIVCPQSWRRCVELLRTAHSPAQAAGRAEAEGLASISHQTVYKRVYADKGSGGTLWHRLRCKKIRRKRYGSGQRRRGRIPNRVGIENRCPRVEDRVTVGHWEGDTVIGRNHKYALVTLVERETGYGIVCKVRTKHADGVAVAIIGALEPIKALVRTITFDDGLEFAKHERITANIGATTFFADPYSSWQRGTNENWNGLIRPQIQSASATDQSGSGVRKAV